MIRQVKRKGTKSESILLEEKHKCKQSHRKWKSALKTSCGCYFAFALGSHPSTCNCTLCKVSVFWMVYNPDKAEKEAFPSPFYQLSTEVWGDHVVYLQPPGRTWMIQYVNASLSGSKVCALYPTNCCLQCKSACLSFSSHRSPSQFQNQPLTPTSSLPQTTLYSPIVPVPPPVSVMWFHIFASFLPECSSLPKSPQTGEAHQRTQVFRGGLMRWPQPSLRRCPHFDLESSWQQHIAGS